MCLDAGSIPATSTITMTKPAISAGFIIVRKQREYKAEQLTAPFVATYQKNGY
jgi:hypothetical protein